MKTQYTPPVERPQLVYELAANIPPGERKHLEALGAAVPEVALSDQAYLALLLIASTGNVVVPEDCVIVDAYEHRAGDWVVEIHVPGHPDREPRFSVSGWQRFYDRHLAPAFEFSSGRHAADIWRAVATRIIAERPTVATLSDDQCRDARESEVR